MRADMVVYGKTVAGGMPIGVVCGRKALMRRFDPERPMRIAYVDRHVLRASRRDGRDERVPALGRDAVDGPGSYDGDEPTLRRRGCARPIARSPAPDLPLRVVHLGTVWTVLFTEPGRYNWLLQYYLRAEGVTLSWVGTGRCLSSMDFSDEDYAALRAKARRRRPADEGRRLVADRGQEHPGGSEHAQAARPGDAREPRARADAASGVLRGGHAAQERRPSRLAQQPRQPAAPHRQLERVPRLLRARLLGPHAPRCGPGLAALFLRQIGHAVLEPPCHDKESRCCSATTRGTRR